MEVNIKIGLFGGSFDPVHNGHLQLANWVKIKLALNNIIFIPAAIPPHKRNLKLADSKHRYRMLQIAVESYSDFEVSDVEIKRKGISYTIDTIIYFQKKMSLDKDSLFLIIGADSLLDFLNWKTPEKIFKSCQVIVLQRPEVNLNRANPKFKQQAIIQRSPLIKISATEIRRRIKEGESISQLVPPAVEQYIYKNNLYK